MTVRVVHVITGLQPGGAEVTLAKLLSALRGQPYDNTVVSLTGSGPVAETIAGLGVPVVALGGHPGVPDPRLVARLGRVICDARADVVQTWLYHADLAGGLAARRAGVPVVWGVHQDAPDPARTKRRTMLVARACARLAHRVPDAIVCCSPVARDGHAAFGYPAARMVVVPNGFDTGAFRPDPEARLSVREELGLPADTPLVGMLARLDPLKDHATFLVAAAAVARARPDARFLLAGDGIQAHRDVLVRCSTDRDLRGRCHLLGPRPDAPRLTAALDVAVSSSRREGFSNTIAEAMACGVPVAATDVGYSAELLEGRGALAEPGDAPALAAGILRLLALGAAERARLGAESRQSIRSRFGLRTMAAGYADVWRRVAARDRDRELVAEPAPVVAVR